MSAAATAAGYLYASGRLRGKKENETEQPAAPQRKRLRVAVLEREEAPAPQEAAPPRPKRVPKVEYRVRRWRPDE